MFWSRSLCVIFVYHVYEVSKSETTLEEWNGTLQNPLCMQQQEPNLALKFCLSCQGFLLRYLNFSPQLCVVDSPSCWPFWRCLHATCDTSGWIWMRSVWCRYPDWTCHHPVLVFFLESTNLLWNECDGTYTSEPESSTLVSFEKYIYIYNIWII